MTVLRDAAGKKYRERNDAGSKECHENHVWPRFRDDADESGKKYHQGGIVAYPVVYVYVMQDDSKCKQYSECPCEYCRKMFLDDMIPEVFLHEMILGEYEDNQHDYAKSCKQHVHPVLAQQIDRFLHALRLVEMTSTFAMVMMGMSVMVMSVTRHSFSVCMSVIVPMFLTRHCEGFARGNLFTFMHMTLMSRMVMSQLASSQPSDEQRQTHQHAYSLPSEMPQIATLRSQ